MAKSRKRKIELFRDCREKLYNLVLDWKETPGKEEDIIYGILKEKVKKERINFKMGKRTENELNGMSASDGRNMSSNVGRRQLLEDDCKMTGKTTLKTTTHTECVKADQVAPIEARTTVRLSTRQNVSKKALNPTSAKVSGQLSINIITKPQNVYSSGVQMPCDRLWTVPTNQWEKSDLIFQF